MIETTHSIFIGIVWTDGENTVRWQVYIPINSPGFPNGKIVAGGTYGTVVESIQVATDCVASAIAEASAELAVTT